MGVFLWVGCVCEGVGIYVIWLGCVRRVGMHWERGRRETTPLYHLNDFIILLH